jgi:hypothetical protein
MLRTCAVWDVTVFTRNRERLMEGAASQRFLDQPQQTQADRTHLRLGEAGPAIASDQAARTDPRGLVLPARDRVEQSRATQEADRAHRSSNRSRLKRSCVSNPGTQSHTRTNNPAKEKNNKNDSPFCSGGVFLRAEGPARYQPGASPRVTSSHQSEGWKPDLSTLGGSHARRLSKRHNHDNKDHQPQNNKTPEKYPFKEIAQIKQGLSATREVRACLRNEPVSRFLFALALSPHIGPRNQIHWKRTLNSPKKPETAHFRQI